MRQWAICSEERCTGAAVSVTVGHALVNDTSVANKLNDQLADTAEECGRGPLNDRLSHLNLCIRETVIRSATDLQ